jgi:hypothetical protein
MATIPQTQLFSWDDIDTASDLDRLRLVLVALSLVDEAFVSYLESKRGKGRDDYPVRPMWNAVIAGIVFQHPAGESLRRELRRNAELRQLCGFDIFAGEAAVPTKDSLSRFLVLVMECEEHLSNMFHELVDLLKAELPNLGKVTAVDSKAIPSFGKPVCDEEKKAVDDRRRDVDGDWGVKQYKGKRKDGTTWEKVTKWFGYKLHLLVDSHYELPLAYEVSRASTNDSPRLIPLVEDIEANHQELYSDIDELSADKGYDSAQNNATLYDNHRIKPVIDNRKMWKNDEVKTLLDDRYDVFCYDESGQVYCQCPSDTQGEDYVTEMAFVGFESDRQTLKFKCPAAHYGFVCPGREECEDLAPFGVGRNGRIVRVPLSTDRRIFTPIARISNKWETAYNRRTAVERVNSRLDRVMGFENHTIRGKRKMTMRVSLALIVMLAMALGRIRIGQVEQMRSLVAPIARVA